MQADISAFMPLPPAPYDACHKVATRVSSMSLVRYRNNDYSVPTRYGHQEVLAKGYVDRVEIACRGETIATHLRSYDKAEFIYNPLHYLALLEHKSKALDQAAPLDDWRLADCVYRLRRLMEARMGNGGRREFIQVLRLMEDFHQHQVEQSIDRDDRWSNFASTENVRTAREMMSRLHLLSIRVNPHLDSLRRWYLKLNFPSNQIIAKAEPRE